VPGARERRTGDHRDPEVHDQPSVRGEEMKWLETREIAIALAEAHPDVDPANVNFVDLYNWVLALDGFDDDPKRSGEKVLEAIQATWIEEAD
jgi:FeS assembly protein IscX